MSQMQGVRTAARAVIRSRGRLLVNHYRSAGRDWYNLPGGGQAVGERLDVTVARECAEELGCGVRVLGLRWVRDYVPAPGAFSYLSEAAHQIEHFFECEVPADYAPRMGGEPDRHQVGVVWLDAEALRNADIHPARLREALDPERVARWPVYWGDEA